MYIYTVLQNWNAHWVYMPKSFLQRNRCTRYLFFRVIATRKRSFDSSSILRLQLSKGLKDWSVASGGGGAGGSKKTSKTCLRLSIEDARVDTLEWIQIGKNVIKQWTSNNQTRNYQGREREREREKKIRRRPSIQNAWSGWKLQIQN